MPGGAVGSNQAYPPGTPFAYRVCREPESSNIFENVGAMPEYANKSFDELRVEDYMLNRKFPTPGSTQPGPAGNAPLTGIGISNAGNISPFNASLGGGSVLGATPTAGSGLFGQPQAGVVGGVAVSPGGSGLFGQTPAATPFGSLGAGGLGAGAFGAGGQAVVSGGVAVTPTSPFGGGLGAGSFAQPQQTGLFGQQQQQQQQQIGILGQQRTGTLGASPFGAQPLTGAGSFGQAASGLFGQQQQQQSQGGLFGQSNNSFSSASSGLFGQQNTNNTLGQSGGLFGQQNQTNSFGANSFASAQSNSSGLFGNQSTTGSDLFGAQSSGGGLFGQQNNNQSGLFGQQQNQSGLFGQSNTGSGGLFGQQNNNSLGGGSGLFGNQNNNNQGGLFGKSSSTPNLFAQQQNQGSSLFNSSLNQSVNQSGLVGQNTGGSMFSHPGFGNNASLFGHNNNSLSLGGFGTGSFGGANVAAGTSFGGQTQITNQQSMFANGNPVAQAQVAQLLAQNQSIQQAVQQAHAPLPSAGVTPTPAPIVPLAPTGPKTPARRAGRLSKIVPQTEPRANQS